MTDAVAGIDIGGTNTKIGLVNAEGKIIARKTLSTPDYAQFIDYIEAIAGAVRELLASQSATLKAVGIGAASANYRTGCIEHAANLPWKGIEPICKELSDRLGVPVYLDNDANAAALGEFKYGVARGIEDMVMITLGTGVGGGVISHGKLIHGANSCGGEVGHLRIDYSDNARQCGCGSKGCLETYCSATGVVRTAKEMYKDGRQALTSLDIYNAACSEDQTAIEIFKTVGRQLGRAMALIIQVTDPQAIVLFGGLAAANRFFMPSLEEEMNKNIMPILRGKCKVLISTLNGADAAILGAAATIPANVSNN